MCREKATNFDCEEIEFLSACVAQNVHHIENEKTDQSLTKAKNASWEAIEFAFRYNPNVKDRSRQQLADKWKNLKQSIARTTVQNYNDDQLVLQDLRGASAASDDMIQTWQSF
uniref:Regulatory protein zeste n=1 Tax=Romanomermis culicivorax TaxID=13658 RepID=A0A915IRT8_ROMCU